MKNTLRPFLAVCSALALMLAPTACDDDEPQQWSPPARGAISSDGAAEGRAGENYIFEFEGDNIPTGINYHWSFDDGGAERVVSDGSPQAQAFAADGRYYVRLRLVARDGGYEIARFLYEANIRSDVRMPALRRISTGSFTMGGDITTPEQPPHQVTITKLFEIGIHEVTQDEYVSLMGDNPSWFEGSGDLPVENLNWYEALEYCNRLSVRAGLQPCYVIDGEDVTFRFNAGGYRLPTEAEWEYACRAGTSSEIYSGGLTNPRTQCIADGSLEPNLDRIAWLCFNSDYRTHPVGQKEANAFELYDMIGNVAEFVWDPFKGEYYAESPRFDPTGPTGGGPRIARGGAYSFGVVRARSAARQILDPLVNSASYGLRLARSLN